WATTATRVAWASCAGGWPAGGLRGRAPTRGGEASAGSAGSTPPRRRSPRARLEILDKAAVEVLAGLAAHDRVHHARRPVHEIERGVEALLVQAGLGGVRAVVGGPAGVDGGHEDAVLREHLLRRG